MLYRMYNKIFTKILDSSIWLENQPTRIVWITFIACMDQDGVVALSSIGNVANRARVSVEEAEAAINCLESPDVYNPDQDQEGRRIERIPGVGWIVLNSKKYRDIVKAETSRLQTRERTKAWRERHKDDGGDADVTVCDENVTPSEAEALSEAETKAKKKSIAQDSDSHSRKDSDHVIDSSSAPKENKGSAADWLDALKKEPIYSHVDFDTEARKAQMWLDDNAPTRKFTKKYFTNWINRIEKPLTITSSPPTSYNYVKGQPTQREAIEAEQEMIRQMEAEQKEIEAMGIQ